MNSHSFIPTFTFCSFPLSSAKDRHWQILMQQGNNRYRVKFAVASTGYAVRTDETIPKSAAGECEVTIKIFFEKLDRYPFLLYFYPIV